MTTRASVLWRLAAAACDEFDLLLTEERIRAAHLAIRYAATESYAAGVDFTKHARALEERVTNAWLELFSKRRSMAEAFARQARRPPLGDTPRTHKKAKHKVVREERIAAGLCTSCGRARDLGGVTCSRCLSTDKAWRKERAVREKTAVYLDDECQPMVLAFTPRMLPVLGPRKDCTKEDDCLTELIRACGKQDAPGSSCPDGCPHFTPYDRKSELLYLASTRDSATSEAAYGEAD